MSVCVCVHTKCVWPLSWNLFCVSMASPNYGLNTACHLILRIALLAPCLSCNLNSRSLDVVCGLYHSDRGGSGSDVSFSYVWTHASWPVWRQTCNLLKPTQRQIGFGRILVPTILFIFLFAPFFVGFSCFPPVCVVLVVFISVQPHFQVCSFSLLFWEARKPLFGLFSYAPIITTAAAAFFNNILSLLSTISRVV